MIALQVHHVLRDGERRFQLDLQFETQATVLALYGPSGAGKSLCLQLLAGLWKPQQGLIRVHGETWLDGGQGISLPPERRAVGYLPQHYALLPHLDVAGNVGFGLSRWWRGPDRAARDRVAELLAAFGLEGLARAPVQRLSGGQRQRVALARALACQPRLLLLDEPFAALNPLLRTGLRAELKAMRERWGVPMVFVTHDLDDVLALADEALLIDQGRVLREVDLQRAEARERAAQALGAEPPADTPRTRLLRRLLSGEGP